MKLTSKTHNNFIMKASVYAILLFVWQAIYVLGVDVFHIWKFYNFPAPVEVVKSLFSISEDNTLSLALGISVQRILIGYGISLIAGIAIGFLLARFTFLENGLSGLILGLQTLPNICWLPFAILWFGLGEGSILFVIIIGSVFSIAMAVDAGVKNIHPVYLKAGRNMGAHGITLLLYIVIPAALPSLVSGMKQGWSFAWRGLIAGEMISASRGLGQLLMAGRELADINQVTAVMIVMITIGVVVDKAVFGPLERRMRSVRGLSV